MRALWMLALLVAAPAEAAEIALVGGEIHTAAGAVIESGTVIVSGERIAAVGKEVAVPKGAQVIDCKGKVVTPGLVDSETGIGLVEIELIDETADDVVQLRDPIHAAVRAADAIDLRSTLVGVARHHGVTSVVSVPQGGLIAGRSAWLDLVDEDSPLLPRAVLPDTAMHATLGELGSMVVGHSRATAVARFLEALDDARIYRTSKPSFARNALHRLSISRLDAEALQPVLTGQMRLVLGVSRAADLSAALAIAQREKLRIAFVGAEEGWLVADELARAKVPVILDAFANLPSRFEGRHARADNAALLTKAGVEVAIATRTSHNVSMLRFALGNAVRAGLSHDAALAAATRIPAQIFGKDAQYGTIERNKLANLVVWTGDPFEPAHHAETVLIRGEVQSIESRQTRLAQKHARRLGLIK
jgi:imidazolonepropionase-like amidohydrolase